MRVGQIKLDGLSLTIFVHASKAWPYLDHLYGQSSVAGLFHTLIGIKRHFGHA